MAGVKQLPRLVTELLDLSKQYLREMIIEPAKSLGKHAAMGVIAGILMAVAAVLLVAAVFSLSRQLLPEGEWWGILARGIGFVAAVIGILGVLWRVRRDG